MLSPPSEPAHIIPRPMSNLHDVARLLTWKPTCCYATNSPQGQDHITLISVLAQRSVKAVLPLEHYSGAGHRVTCLEVVAVAL